MLTFIRRLFYGRRKTAAAIDSTPLSEFVRAPSRDKKKVYDVALKRAAAAQREVVDRHRACA